MLEEQDKKERAERVKRIREERSVIPLKTTIIIINQNEKLLSKPLAGNECMTWWCFMAWLKFISFL